MLHLDGSNCYRKPAQRNLLGTLTVVLKRAGITKLIVMWFHMQVLVRVQVCLIVSTVNPLNAELNPICYLLALLVHHFLHVSSIRVKSLTLRLLMSYIYEAPILDVFRSHTTKQHSR